MLIVTFLILLTFCLFFAKNKNRNKWFSLSVGVVVTIVALLPFRTYKVSILEPSIQQNLSDQSILQTKEISIPGYPGAYNPSLIPCEDGYLLSFRVKKYDVASWLKKIKNVRTSYLGLVKLDRHFQICEKPYLLDIYSYASDQISHSAQDARLFQMDGKTLLIFNDYGDSFHRHNYKLYCVELIQQSGKWKPQGAALPLNYEKQITIEKNWTPFESKGSLHLIYSTTPHLILKVNLETGVCTEVAKTDPPFNWDYGIIRGGTPAYPIDGGLLTLFHSSIEVPADSLLGTTRGRNYVMSGYLFENKPPFKLKKWIPHPIGTLDDYARNRRKVIFPGGLVITHDQIIIAWGKNDNAICLTVCDKQKLMQELVS